MSATTQDDAAQQAIAEPGRVWTGGCLCGAVRYTITEQPSAISFCHCGQCRRLHSHVGAYTTFPRTAIRITGDEQLGWFASSERARRGFCTRCGTALFWDPIGQPRFDATAGSLDEPTGLIADRHIWVDFQGDYYHIGDDGLPHLRSTDAANASGVPVDG